MLKILGIALVGIGAIGFMRVYSRRAAAGVNEGCDLLALIEYVRREAKLRRSTHSVWEISDICVHLSHTDFARLLKEYPLGKAYSMCESEMHLSDEVRAVVGEFFRAFGGGTCNDDITAADECICRLARIIAAEREEVQKRIKSMYALVGSLTVGFIIYFI